MSAPDTAVRWRCAVAVLSGCSLMAIGCTLFSPLNLPTATTVQRQVLPPIKAPGDAVQLQVVFIERPTDDPLVRQLLWQDLDQVGAIPPETRQVLENNGLRIGQAGANPPPSLQKLLGLTGELVDPADQERQLMRGRRLGLRSGQETEIQSLDLVQDCTIRYVLNGQTETAEYLQSRPVLQVRPVRVQDGWVRVEFAPEIHHGQARLRHTATEEGWALKGGQQCDARHPLKFQLMLNTGEFAVISGNVDQPESAGYRMFCYEVEGRLTQRLLVLRLADSGRTEADSALK